MDQTQVWPFFARGQADLNFGAYEKLQIYKSSPHLGLISYYFMLFSMI